MVVILKGGDGMTDNIIVRALFFNFGIFITALGITIMITAIME
mgnify:CR=1 FL=1